MPDTFLESLRGVLRRRRADPFGRRGVFGLEPQPLVIPDAKLVVAWSPRSASSHVVLWSFHHQGLVERARAYHRWPHRYRQFVYYRNDGYRRRVRDALASDARGYTLLKVTRDPAKRLVSIFRHACRFPFLAGPVRSRLGFDLRTRGLSLRDLDAVLGGMNLVVPTNANPHVCAQYHPVWDMAFDRVITLDIDSLDLDAALNEVEADLGLPTTDFAAIRGFAQMRKHRHARNQPLAIDGPLEEHRFMPDQVAAFPKSQFEALPAVADMARRHYGADLGRVEADDSLGRLSWAIPATAASS
jgi:hypothetical protein